MCWNSSDCSLLKHSDREIPLPGYLLTLLQKWRGRQEDYLIIVKLVAILRVANALDRSHKQKFEQVRLTLKDAQLEIVVDTSEDITLEKGLFPPKADYFEEVFHVRPLIRKKRNL